MKTFSLAHAMVQFCPMVLSVQTLTKAENSEEITENLAENSEEIEETIAENSQKNKEAEGEKKVAERFVSFNFATNGDNL